MEKVKVKGKEYDLEDKDAVLILTLQDLINELRKLRVSWGRS